MEITTTHVSNPLGDISYDFCSPIIIRGPYTLMGVEGYDIGKASNSGTVEISLLPYDMRDL